MTVQVLIVDDEEGMLGLAKSTIDIDESYDSTTLAGPTKATQPWPPL